MMDWLFLAKSGIYGTLGAGVLFSLFRLYRLMKVAARARIIEAEYAETAQRLSAAQKDAQAFANPKRSRDDIANVL